MALAQLLPSDDTPQARALFSFAHARDHDEIDAVLRARGIAQVTVPLDPIPWDSPEGGAFFLRLHQQKHAQMDAAVGTQSTDLTGFDLSKKNDRDAFIAANYDEHLLVRQILGLR